MQSREFSDLLSDWWRIHKRLNLPWKTSKDPYVVWLSEVILQQTRVVQGSPYFLRFYTKFPTVFSLAEAPLDEVIKSWEGLGYYSRVRNLHATAQKIVNTYKGVFPQSYNELLKLKGIGPYTAAAIASFSFGLPYPVVDGNVIRLISRILGITEPVDRPEVKRRIQSFVEQAIRCMDAADFNQAIMDAGATMCTPARPACTQCPFQEHCHAHLRDIKDRIPVKAPKAALKRRYFHYFDIWLPNTKTLIHQRQTGDIWSMLYEFPMLASDHHSPLEIDEIVSFLKNVLISETWADVSCSLACVKKQKLTHQDIQAHIYRVDMGHMAEQIKPGFYLVDREKVSNFAFPKLLSDYIKAADF